MDKAIRLDKLNTSAADPNATKAWKLWYRNFTYFLHTIKSISPDKLEVLFLYIGTDAADVIEDFASFDDTIEKLESVYLKPPGEVHARNLLLTQIQRAKILRHQRRDCKDIYLYIYIYGYSIYIYHEESIRDSFIRELRSSAIHTRLLDNSSLNLNSAIQQARALEQAQIRSDSYFPQQDELMSAAVVTEAVNETTITESEVPFAAATLKASFNGKRSSCYSCGDPRHQNDNRRLCPARDAVCRKCVKLGYFAKVCRSSRVNSNRNDLCARF